MFVVEKKIVAITSKKLPFKALPPGVSGLIEDLRGRGLKISAVKGHEVSYAGIANPQGNWHSFCVTHPGLSGKKLNDFVQAAVNEVQAKFYAGRRMKAADGLDTTFPLRINATCLSCVQPVI